MHFLFSCRCCKVELIKIEVYAKKCINYIKWHNIHVVQERKNKDYALKFTKQLIQDFN